MKEIKTGDIVVSMINQSTEIGSCPIPMGYVSKAIVGEAFESKDQVVWFEETTYLEGSYPAENFRLATKEEARLKWPCSLSLDHFDFLPGDKVSTKYSATGTVVGISTNNIKPSYLVKLDNRLKYGHNGNNVSLFIGSAKGLNNDGWYYDAEDLQRLNFSSTSTDAIFVHPHPWGNPTFIVGSSNAYLPKDYVDFSKLSGHNVPSYLKGLEHDIDLEKARLQEYREAKLQELHSQSMLKEIQSMFSSKKDVNHQDAIILKSKSNKRKLITI